MTVQISAPLTCEAIARLHAGDEVAVSGTIYIARDAAHKRFIEIIGRGEELPFDPKGQIIYYAGPAPAKPGKVIGSVGPTTSSRMDAYTVQLLERGLKGMIGKGKRSPEVKEAIRKHHAVYMAALGGAGVLASQSFVSAEVIAYPELGPEAVVRAEVRDFPAFVVCDMYGNDLYEDGAKRYRIDS